MKQLVETFLASLKAQLDPRSATYKAFITDHTYLEGKNFSFRDHEFQEYVIDVVENNPGCTFSISKCSQIGLSEIFNRLILAKMAVKPGTSVIVSFPSITFSQEVFKTRLSSVISSSPQLSALKDPNNDSASVKAFHNDSIAYALGGSEKSRSSLLNRPIDTVFVDEYDRQDPDVVSGY